MSNPIVTIEMEQGGIIRAELYPDVAPNTVRNFISLIQKGFYNGTIFHRVIPGFKNDSFVLGHTNKREKTSPFPAFCPSGHFRFELYFLTLGVNHSM